ncbi:M42 family metallopeptidase [Falsirhodobacter sp. 1013]|uniref:M42 family metallopeptidase n=1 Tax=Falsirhodobacter sp. 1013 TaxID=3417566 RepID=UPI003EB6C1A1
MTCLSLDFLKDLIAAPSPSGYEKFVARLYRDYVTPFADEVRTDVMGNVTAILNPQATMKIMLAAHMDEIGFIIHHIGSDGLLYFSPIGGHDATTPLGQRVWVHGRSRIPGVVGREAIHLLDPTEVGQKPAMEDLWIDIGASTREEVEALITLGDVVTFQYEFQPLMGDRVTGRAFDNKAGLLIIAEALRMLRQEGGLDLNVGVYAVATVQEEIGSRGAETAAYAIAPQSGLAVDMGQATDYRDALTSRYGRFDIGMGPAIDRGANTNHEVFRLLSEAAAEEKIAYQIHATGSTTPTDAQALQTNRGGMATGLLSVPLRYMHTPSEVISLKDVEATARLMAAYCRRITPFTDFRPH